MSPVQGRPEPSPTLPAILGLTAGIVDVTGWLTLGGLFTAHITGNLVVIAAHLVDGRGTYAAQVLAVPLFVVVAALVAFIARRSHPGGERLTRVLLGLQALLLVGAASAATILPPLADPHGLASLPLAMLAVAAMASQNALLHLIRTPTPTTQVMTGNIVLATMSLAECVASRWSDDRAAARWRATWPIIASFLAGCVVGAAGVAALGRLSWWLAAGVAVGLAVLNLFRQRTLEERQDRA